MFYTLFYSILLSFLYAIGNSNADENVRHVLNGQNGYIATFFDHVDYKYSFVSGDSLDCFDLSNKGPLLKHIKLDFTADVISFLNDNPRSVSMASMPKDMDALAVADKKALFFSILQPIVKFHNQVTSIIRLRLNKLSYSQADNTFIERMADEYALDRYDGNLSTRKDSLRELLNRIDHVPCSLVLAQAAIESGWGTSRFAREANNLFGQRVWNKDIPGLQILSDSDARFRLAIFPNISASVRSYMRNINSHPSYAIFRDLRSNMRENSTPPTGMQLAEGLIMYSTRRDDYVRDIKLLIESNKLYHFDSSISK